MTKEEAKEAIKVMQAFVDGKKIEWKPKGDNIGWEEKPDPVFDFSDNKYRVKPEPTMRPYKDIEELKADLIENGGYVVSNKTDCVHQIRYVTNRIGIEGGNYGFSELLKTFHWLKSGKPCGVLE